MGREVRAGNRGEGERLEQGMEGREGGYRWEWKRGREVRAGNGREGGRKSSEWNRRVRAGNGREGLELRMEERERG